MRAKGGCIESFLDREFRLFEFNACEEGKGIFSGGGVIEIGGRAEVGLEGENRVI